MCKAGIDWGSFANKIVDGALKLGKLIIYPGDLMTRIFETLHPHRPLLFIYLFILSSPPCFDIHGYTYLPYLT